jgi:chitinase
LKEFFIVGVTSSAQNGFSQPTSGSIPGDKDVFDYDEIKRTFYPSLSHYWDDVSKVPFLYNPSTFIWISYDDETSIQLKCDYIKQESLGGAMFWQFSGDRNNELISVAFNALRREKKD